MTIINQKEYEVLKSLEYKWKWIARDLGDHGGNLFAYSEKPFKHDMEWMDYGRWVHHIDNRLFPFIQWEDEEPRSISGLIRRYESEQAEALRMHDSKETEYELTKDFLNLLEVMHRIEHDYDSETRKIYPVGGNEDGRPVNYDFYFEFDRHGNFIGLENERIKLKLYSESEEDSDDDKIEVPKWFNEWYKNGGYEKSAYGALNELYEEYKSSMEDWSGKYENSHAELQEDICRIVMGGRDVYRVEDETEYSVYFVDKIKDGERVGFFLYRDDEGIHMDTKMNNYMNYHPSCRLTEDEIKTYSEALWDLAIENDSHIEDYYYIKRLGVGVGDKNYFKSFNGGNSWVEKNEADRVLGDHRADYLVNNLDGIGVHKVKI